MKSVIDLLADNWREIDRLAIGPHTFVPALAKQVIRQKLQALSNTNAFNNHFSTRVLEAEQTNLRAVSRHNGRKLRLLSNY